MIVYHSYEDEEDRIEWEDLSDDEFDVMLDQIEKENDDED